MRKRKLADRGTQESDTIYNQPLSRFFSRMADLFILSLFWLATSWPIVTIGASTTALFYVCFRMWRREEGGLWKTYIKSFKENFKQATFIWLLYLFLVLDVCLIGYSLYQNGVFQLSDFLYEDGKCYSALVIVCLVYMSIMLYTAGLWRRSGRRSVNASGARSRWRLAACPARSCFCWWFGCCTS